MQDELTFDDYVRQVASSTLPEHDACALLEEAGLRYESALEAVQAARAHLVNPHLAPVVPQRPV